jgi:hypothetical protein
VGNRPNPLSTHCSRGRDLHDQATTHVATGIAAVPTSAYIRANLATVPAGFCNCVDVGCDRAGDLLVSCEGNTANNGTGYLTKVGRNVDVTSCETCVCTTGMVSTGVAVSVLCLRP